MNASDATFPDDAIRLHTRVWARVRRMLLFVWRWGFGAFLCLSPPGSIVVVGWTLRRAAATAHAEWTENGPKPARPNWIVREGGGVWSSGAAHDAVLRRARARAASLVHSLAINFRVGLASLLVVWSITLPGCMLWLFAWYAGWNNSFTKGYENAGVGPLTGLLGTALFIAAMMYVPMAQARHAVTGDWRSFYRFRVVWRMMRQCRFRYLCLAALYAATALPVMILKSAPMVFTQIGDVWEPVTAVEARETLDSYFFWACVAVFPLFVALRVVGARVYAVAARRAVAAGRIDPADLHPVEADALAALAPSEPMKRRRGGRALTTVWVAALALVWFAFVAQIFVSEFLNYHPGVGWLNQPTAQAPWFHYIPGHLKN